MLQPFKPQVVYSVGEREMSWLSHLAHKGDIRMPRGMARHLEAICSEVWPDMRIRVDVDAETHERQMEPMCTLTALRHFGAYLRHTATDLWIRRQNWPRLAEEFASQLTIRRSVEDVVRDFCDHRAEVWAASREEAEAVWTEQAAREGLTVQIEWDPSPC